VIDAAYRHGTRKLLFLGSSRVYPKHALQPIIEDARLTGRLEKTNQGYTIAKIAGLKMCQAYRRQYGFDAISVMPTDLYGPGDSFDLENSHVLPALMRKVHVAKQAGEGTVIVWGTGMSRREFLHVDGLAGACLFLMGRYSNEDLVNVGWVRTFRSASLAELWRGHRLQGAVRV
jgi:GDP-L-fucose synthase